MFSSNSGSDSTQPVTDALSGIIDMVETSFSPDLHQSYTFKSICQSTQVHISGKGQRIGMQHPSQVEISGLVYPACITAEGSQ